MKFYDGNKQGTVTKQTNEEKPTLGRMMKENFSKKDTFKLILEEAIHIKNIRTSGWGKDTCGRNSRITTSESYPII